MRCYSGRTCVWRAAPGCGAIYRLQVTRFLFSVCSPPASDLDICLKEVTSIADSLYNIQLLKEFAGEYLNKSFYLSMEDMLYSPLVLKVNGIASHPLQQ